MHSILPHMNVTILLRYAWYVNKVLWHHFKTLIFLLSQFKVRVKKAFNTDIIFPVVITTVPPNTEPSADPVLREQIFIALANYLASRAAAVAIVLSASFVVMAVILCNFWAAMLIVSTIIWYIWLSSWKFILQKNLVKVGMFSILPLWNYFPNQVCLVEMCG